MSLREKVRELIAELDRIHPDGFFSDREWSFDVDGLFDFATAECGQQRHFSNEAREVLDEVVSTIYENDSKFSSLMQHKEFAAYVRQCVADLHACGELHASEAFDLDSAHSSLLERIRDRVSKVPLTFTHYFPAWTLGMDHEGPFQLGPVTISTRTQWIQAVEFSPTTIEKYLNTPQENARWKESLLCSLQDGDPSAKLKGLAETIYRSVRDCPSVLKVTMHGFERTLSRKLAEIVCKSALDSISLIFGGGDFFHQQALCHERLQPFRNHNLVEYNGHLTIPGTKLGPRVRHLSHFEVKEHLATNSQLLNAVGDVLHVLAGLTQSKHPKLSKRWATALDWLAEGSRERNDAVALTKIATSLDVLSCGGKYQGILSLLVHLTKTDANTIVIDGRNPRTLRQLVKDIYDNGRSQILHGTHVDRIKSFETWRSHAAYCARVALLESALRLSNYNGPDIDDGFRTMSG